MNIKILPGILFLTAVSLISHAAPPQNGCTKHDTFPTACNPFGGSATTAAIDSVCGIGGDASDPGDLAQDKVKNNLCATGTPHELSLAELTKLQEGVDASGLVYGNHFVHPELPPLTADRASFFEKEHADGFGEGDPVVFVGFIVDTKKGDSETVNCHCTPTAFNDIHVTLADHPLHLRKAPPGATAAEKAQVRRSNNRLLCLNAFTAEVIPHRRPAALERASLNTLSRVPNGWGGVGSHLHFEVDEWIGNTWGGGTPIAIDPYGWQPKTPGQMDPYSQLHPGILNQTLWVP